MAVNRSAIVAAKVSSELVGGRARSVLRLEGKSGLSGEGVTLGGAAVGAAGRWQPRPTETVRGDGGVRVAPMSAAIIEVD